MKIQNASMRVLGASDIVRSAPGTQAQGLRIEPGVIRLFSKGDIGARGLLSGWAAPEEGHTWNDGIETAVLLEAEVPEGPVTIVIEGTPYLYGQVSHQDVTLFANGYRVGFWRLTERRQIALTARIEPEQWFMRNGKASLRLVFNIPESIRPKELGDGADGRELGFAFCTIHIAEER